MNRKIFSWALYDWANSAYATTVMAGFFPVLLKQYWAHDLPLTQSTSILALANTLASLFIVILAPLLGALADNFGGKKRFLSVFAFIGIVMTLSLYAVAQGQWLMAVFCYVVASLGFLGGNIFYDALLVDVVDEQGRDRVSALGYAMGYLGGGLLFALNVAMMLRPEWFLLDSAEQAVRLSFLSVGAWWLLFCIPLFLWVEERPVKAHVSWSEALFASFRQLLWTYREIRRLKMVFLFLVAYWLYIDGVDTVVRMAVDYGMSVGLRYQDLIAALLITQFVGFPSALVFGMLGERIGARAGIQVGLAVYLGVLVVAFFMDSTTDFYALAIVIGLVQGGVQSLSRSFYSRLIPREKAAEFFGFYNMMGKFAVILGPVLIGWIGALTGSPRLGILSISLLFIGGWIVLLFVREERFAD